LNVGTDRARDEYSRYVAAQGEIGRFHARWEQHDYRTIYGNADATLRSTMTLEQLQNRLEGFAARLGRLTRTREVQRQLDWKGDDLFLTQVMDSQFEKTVAVETFVWRVTASNVVYLVNYDVEIGGVSLSG
jgi:hypothetical protein